MDRLAGILAHHDMAAHQPLCAPVGLVAIDEEESLLHESDMNVEYIQVERRAEARLDDIMMPDLVELSSIKVLKTVAEKAMSDS